MNIIVLVGTYNNCNTSLLGNFFKKKSIGKSINKRSFIEFLFYFVLFIMVNYNFRI